MIIDLKNSRISVSIELEPFFVIQSFIDLKNGKNMLADGTSRVIADREFLKESRLLDSKPTTGGYEFRWDISGVILTRHLFFYDNSPAIRWYDTFTSAENRAGMYYSTLFDFKFGQVLEAAKVVNFFSCSDQSNHRLIETPAEQGRYKGAYFIGGGLFIYKEGPMPDCQPIKGEYDFIYNSAARHLEVVGLGFDNLRPGENRRANGVVIGLSENHGMQRYWLERYGEMPVETLSNSWPDLTLGVDEEAITKELHAAAESGITCVFIDDGWFSSFMGEIDEVKFPNKFTKLAEIARGYGIEIGLWCNPLGLDVRHEKMRIWDGAECRDTMLEENPWNWLARTDDFIYTELHASPEHKRGYASLELLKPEVFEFMKNKIADLYKNYGIRHFKFDLYQLTAFNTMLGDANIHYEKYRELLETLQNEIPELIISMDVTRRNRPNFDFALDFGRLFLENRGRTNKDHRYYHPYMALGNIWYTLKYAPASRLEIEMMPQAEDYDLEYILGTTIFAAPLYWGAIVNTSPERRAQMKDFFAMIEPYRKKFAGYLTTSSGEMPVNGAWSAITSVAPDYHEGFIAVYRNGATTGKYTFEIPFGAGVEKVFGKGSAVIENGKLKAELPDQYSCALYRFS